MSVVYIGGVPGTGKTLFATYLMMRKFRKENIFFKRWFSKKLYLNIFSNYPINLYKNYYSYYISLDDFKRYNKHVPDCDIVLDEFQSYYDSLDFKDFPRNISKNFQFHRHFGIHDIYLISQHPSRIVKQARILINEFYQVTRFIKLPFGFGFLRYNIYYNFEDYGKSVNVKKEDVAYDFKKKFLFFRYKKVFNAYNTKYMRALVDDKPYLDTSQYSSKDLSLNLIKKNFNMS